MPNFYLCKTANSDATFDGDNWQQIGLRDITSSTINTEVTTSTVNTKVLSGSIFGRALHAHVGDATSGLIYGGTTAIGAIGNGAPYSDFQQYSVSGDAVTVTTLNKTGTTLPGLFGHVMFGTPTAGFITGGIMRSGSSLSVNANAYTYTVSGTDVAIATITKTGSSDQNAIGDYVYNATSARSVGAASNASGNPTFNMPSINRGVLFTGTSSSVTASQQTSLGTTGRWGSYIVANSDLSSYIIFPHGNSSSNNTTAPDIRHLGTAYLSGSGTALTSPTPAIDFRKAAGDDTDFMLFGGFTSHANYLDTGNSKQSTNVFHRVKRTNNTLAFTQLTISGDTVHPRLYHTMVGDGDNGLIVGGLTKRFTTANPNIPAEATVRGDFVRYSTSKSSGLKTTAQTISSEAITNNVYYTISVISGNVNNVRPIDSVTIRGSDIGSSSSVKTRLYTGSGSANDYVEIYKNSSNSLLGLRGSGVSALNKIRIIKHG